MRPIAKPAIIANHADGTPIVLKKPAHAKPYLEGCVGDFCAYCEERHHNLQVEHIIPVSQDPSKKLDWENLVLACSRCNGRDNKSSNPVDLDQIHFPHLDNTLLSICYREGGHVEPNPGLPESERSKAERLINLVGLNKRPGNTKWNRNDQRWLYRDEQWKKAATKREEFEKGNLKMDMIVEFALQKGYFSIWFTVFEAHPEVRAALIQAFIGTPQSCFDPQNGYTPIPRHRAS